MCDYSATGVKQRAAAVNDVLVSQAISTHTRGFADAKDRETAVCLLPGTELQFKKPVRVHSGGIMELLSGGGLWAFLCGSRSLEYSVARFTQANKYNTSMHHDTLEFPDGKMVLLNSLPQGQIATVIQLPVDPATLSGTARIKAAEAQRRAAYT